MLNDLSDKRPRVALLSLLIENRKLGMAMLGGDWFIL